MKIFIFYILIPALILIAGINMTKKQETNLQFYVKISKIIKLHPKIIKNFIGNFIMFSPIIYYVYFAYGIFNPIFYFSISAILLFAMVWHIKDVSGKPIDIVLSNFNLSVSHMKKNFFMKFVVIMIISCFCTSLTMTKVIQPFFEKTGIIQEDNNEKNVEE